MFNVAELLNCTALNSGLRIDKVDKTHPVLASGKKYGKNSFVIDFCFFFFSKGSRLIGQLS